MIIIILQIKLVFIPALKSCFSFNAGIIFGQHFSYKYVCITIVIDIGHIRTHRSIAYAYHLVFQFFFECAVMLVDIEIISFKKIIGNINVLPAIIVYITYRNSKPKANDASINACLFTYVSKMTIVISKKFMTSQRIPFIPFIFFKIKAPDCFKRIVQ